MPAVEVDSLTISYGKVTAVDGLSFTAEAGEVTCLLGPNGAGKTSTVEALEGLRRPTSGRLSVIGLDPLTDHGSLTPRIGVMLQEGGIHPAVRVREAIRHAAALYPDPVDARALLDRLGLAGLERRTYRQLSGGEQRRLALALALVGRPQVAFLDEPTSGVDPAGRQVIRQVVADLRNDGVTVLLTTHDLDEAERIADHVVIILDGRLVAAGTVDDLTRSSGGDEQVRFRAPAGLDRASLADHLDGADVVEIAPGDYAVALPPSPRTVAAITAWLAEHDQPLADLRAGRQRLEDVYLRLTADGAPAPAGSPASDPDLVPESEPEPESASGEQAAAASRTTSADDAGGGTAGSGAADDRTGAAGWPWEDDTDDPPGAAGRPRDDETTSDSGRPAGDDTGTTDHSPGAAGWPWDDSDDDTDTATVDEATSGSGWRADDDGTEWAPTVSRMTDDPDDVTNAGTNAGTPDLAPSAGPRSNPDLAPSARPRSNPDLAPSAGPRSNPDLAPSAGPRDEDSDPGDPDDPRDGDPIEEDRPAGESSAGASDAAVIGAGDSGDTDAHSDRVDGAIELDADPDTPVTRASADRPGRDKRRRLRRPGRRARAGDRTDPPAPAGDPGASAPSTFDEFWRSVERGTVDDAEADWSGWKDERDRRGGERR